MAGGIDWFRWHHGSVNDPKFQLVARQASATVAEVVAVWASLLEAASSAAQRGHPGEPDFEAMDCALGIESGRSEAIYARMRLRGLLRDDGSITQWEARQPRRERDDLSTERVRALRARERQETPRNADETQETPRREKRREEKKDSARKRASSIPEGFAPNENGVRLAGEAGLDLPRELAGFRDHHTAKGSRFLDWQAAWRTWVGHAVNFGRGKPVADNVRKLVL
jgi:hypothetical protein